MSRELTLNDAFRHAIQRKNWRIADKLLFGLPCDNPAVVHNRRLLNRIRSAEKSSSSSPKWLKSISSIKERYNAAIIAINQGQRQAAIAILTSALMEVKLEELCLVDEDAWNLISTLLLLCDTLLHLRQPKTVITYLTAPVLRTAIQRVIHTVTHLDTSFHQKYRIRWIADAYTSIKMRYCIQIYDWNEFHATVLLRLAGSALDVACIAFNLEKPSFIDNLKTKDGSRLRSRQKMLENEVAYMLDEDDPSWWLLRARASFMNAKFPLLLSKSGDDSPELNYSSVDRVKINQAKEELSRANNAIHDLQNEINRAEGFKEGNHSKMINPRILQLKSSWILLSIALEITEDCPKWTLCIMNPIQAILDEFAARFKAGDLLIELRQYYSCFLYSLGLMCSFVPTCFVHSFESDRHLLAYRLVSSLFATSTIENKENAVWSCIMPGNRAIFHTRKAEITSRCYRRILKLNEMPNKDEFISLYIKNALKRFNVDSVVDLHQLCQNEWETAIEESKRSEDTRDMIILNGFSSTELTLYTQMQLSCHVLEWNNSSGNAALPPYMDLLRNSSQILSNLFEKDFNAFASHLTHAR